MLRISFLTDQRSWKNEHIKGFVETLRGQGHTVNWVHEVDLIPRGDLLFILGFLKVLGTSVLSRNTNNLVVHESALPAGRGWSPMTWQIVEGKEALPLTLFEAVSKVDAGPVYLRGRVPLSGNELLGEIRAKVAAEMLRLCAEFVTRYPGIVREGKEQEGTPSFYPKRSADSSRLDPMKSISQQFDLLRIVDNELYPAFFELRGATYILKIEKKS